MGFWSVLDKALGFVPIVGTIKDGVEAAVLELQGKHEAAKEKAMEAVIDLACDVVTVATLGEGYEVAAVGKVAAEAAMKDIVEQGAKEAAKDVGKAAAETTTKDVGEQGGKGAFRGRTDSASTVATLSDLDVEAAISHEESASRAAALKEGHSVDQIAKAAAKGSQEAKNSQFSTQTTSVIAAAEAARSAKAQARQKIHGKGHEEPAEPDTEPKKDEKEPSKRGEHVINNGVRKVLPKMIDKFLEINHLRFRNKTFSELRDEGFILPVMRVYQSHEVPLPRDIDLLIQGMSVQLPKGQKYEDLNSAQYGEMICSLTTVVVHYMTTLFDSLVQEHPPSRLDTYEQTMTRAFTEIVERINTPSSEVYVDQHALRLWRATRGNREADYRRARDAVAHMFNTLLPSERTVAGWVYELFRAYRTINQ